MSRLRIVTATLTLQALVDDGDNLTPVEVSPITVPWGQWEQFVTTGLPGAVEHLREQVEDARKTESN